MISDENITTTEKKRQRKLKSFLSNGKLHFLNSMGYQPTTTTPHKKGALITKGIFGAPLKSATLCGTCNEYGLTVPDPVYRCFDEIMRRGLLVEGIFRLSGAAPEVENLFMNFDNPPTYGKYMDLKSYDIHAITGVVKKYLRQLPDPAIPIVCHEDFIQLYDQAFSKKSTINTLASMIQQLPREHFHLIHYIIIMASSIQKHAEINMMNPEALAVVLAPVCTGLEQNLKEIPSWVKRHTRTKMMNDMGHFIETNTKWTRIWTLLIEYSDTLLELWKDSLLWEVIVTPPGRNTVPCCIPSTSPSGSYLNASSGLVETEIQPSLAHPGRHPLQHQQSTQMELLLNIAPPHTPPVQQQPQRRPSPHTNKSSDELYKVVVMRKRQGSTNCKSIKSSSKRSSLLMDNNNASSYQHQFYTAGAATNAAATSPTCTNSTTTSKSRISNASSTATSSISSNRSMMHPSLSSSTVNSLFSKSSLTLTTAAE